MSVVCVSMQMAQQNEGLDFSPMFFRDMPHYAKTAGRLSGHTP